MYVCGSGVYSKRSTGVPIQVVRIVIRYTYMNCIHIQRYTRIIVLFLKNIYYSGYMRVILFIYNLYPGIFCFFVLFFVF